MNATVAGDDAPEIRNVAVVGPAGSGKTTLIETLLARLGAIPRAGRVEDGTTVSDTEEIEREIGHSVALTAATVDVTGPELTGGGSVRLTLLDAPGSPDFTGELRAALRGADAVLFVVSAVDGIDGPVRRVWDECAAVRAPRALVLTEVDSERADFDGVLAELQAAFGDGVDPLYLPRRDGADLQLVSVIRTQLIDGFGADRTLAPLPADEVGGVAALRADLIEEVITEAGDEDLMARYLDGDELGFAALAGDLAAATARAEFFPVLPVVGPAGLGIPQLLRVLCRGFPVPADHVLPPVYSPQGADRPALAHRDDEPLVATVLRTITDPYVGRLSLVRVYAGTLQAEQTVHVAGRFSRTDEPGPPDWHEDHDSEEKTGALYRTLGEDRRLLDVARAGDIVVVARLLGAETGDTLSDPGRPAVLVPWELPDPTYPAALRVAPSDEVKLVQGLQRLLAEDPSARSEVSPATGQLLLWTQGEQHLQVLLARLSRGGGFEVLQDPVQVALRETLSGESEVQGKHVKQTGGHGQYAVVEMRFAPLAGGSRPGSGAGPVLEFVSEVTGGAVPRQYVPAVEQGIRTQMERGLRGWPLTGVRAVLLHGKAHSVDSSDAAFQAAAGLALQEAATASGTTMLEPIERVRIGCDDETVGAVLGGLGQRRGRVEATESIGDSRSMIVAEVPAFELLRYAPVLRSQSRGTGTVRREHLRYEAVPAQLVATLAAGA